MHPKTLFRTGLVGAVIAVVCCFTPVLVWLVAAIGLASLTPYLDGFSFTVLAICILLILLGWVHGRSA